MGQQEENRETTGAGQSPKGSAEDTTTLKGAMQTLNHVLERHLMMFLYATRVYRGNPTIKKHQYDSALEAIPSPEVPNPGDSDDDGEFLLDPSNHRILIDHLERVYRGFGKGQGNRPVQNVCHAHEDATGKTVREYGWEEVEGGTLPAWCPNEGCVWYLQRSTTAVLDAVCVLREADPSGRFTAIADLAKDVAYPVGHPTWEIPSTGRPEKNIPYEYPSLVRGAIAKIKDAKTQIHRRQGSSPQQEAISETEEAYVRIDFNNERIVIDGVRYTTSEPAIWRFLGTLRLDRPAKRRTPLRTRGEDWKNAEDRLRTKVGGRKNLRRIVLMAGRGMRRLAEDVVIEDDLQPRRGKMR